jgi:hypothetical protein
MKDRNMTSTTTVSTRGLRGVCLALIVLGLLAAGAALYQRVRTEGHNRAVELVADYNELIALAGQAGVLPGRVMQDLKRAGVTAVALPEETLTNLEADGRISFAARPDFQLGHYKGGWVPSDSIFQVDTGDLAVNYFIKDGLARVYPKENILVEAPFRIMVRGNRDFVADLGLGLDGSKVSVIQQNGLRVIPRLRGGAGITAKSLRASLAHVAETLGTPMASLTNSLTLPTVNGKPVMPTGSAPGETIVVFDGDTIPGYRELIKTDLVAALRENHLVYGAVEFGKQKGDDDLGRALNGRLVRVHSITLAELGNLSPNQVVQRFALAVKDRNIRVLVMHLPPVASADPLKHAADFAAGIAGELRSEGFGVTVAKPARPFPDISVPVPALALIFAGAGASVLLWLITILPQALPVWWVRIGYLLIGIGLAKAVGLAMVMPNLGRAGFGLAAAIGFPLLGLTFAYRALDRLAGQRPARALLQGIATLIVTTGITLLGGLLIAGMMSDTRYLVKVHQFVGVKATLALPLLIFAVVVMSDAVALAGESLADYRARTRARLQAVLNQPLYLWGAVAALVGLVVLALALARSGNDSGVGVSNSELQFRSTLERFLVARPRTKEFLFGHPLFLFAMAAASQGKRPLALALLLGAAIGQADVLNTYCHAHTPVLLSLLRTANGLWLGIVIGAALLLVFGYRGAKQA